MRPLGNVGDKPCERILPVACAAVRMRSERHGRFVVTSLGVSTPLGTAVGQGYLDLGAERVSIILQGQPRTDRPLQIAAPVQIAGPMLAPKVTVLPGRKARAIGLKGMIGVALTPLADLLPTRARNARLPLAAARTCG